MTVRNSFAGLPPFLFGDGGLQNQLVCDVRTYVRANDGSRDLLAPMLAWSAGPPAIGDTGDNSTGHMTGTTWLLQVCPDGSWVLYREDRGRLEVIPWDDPPDPVTATARHVSLCFDQSARVVLAWEDQGIIKVRRWDPTLNEYIENVSFSGVDPVVVFDAQWAYRIPGSDVLVFYLSPDRTRVLCRVQRDVYAVEHEIWDYGVPVILDRATPGFLRYQLLLADGDGVARERVLLSAIYPYQAWTYATAEALPPASGAYARAVLSVEVAETTSALATGPASGSYDEPIITVNLPTDELSGAGVGPTGGSYDEPIISVSLGDDLEAAASPPHDGEYVDVVINASLEPDELAAAGAGPSGGTYEAA